MHPTRRTAAAFATLALAACTPGDPTFATELAPPFTPMVELTYTGPLDGTWRAAGTLHVPSATTTTWASGLRTGGRLEIQAIRQNTDGTHDWIQIDLDRTTRGQGAIDASCSGPGCPGVTIAFGMHSEHGAQAAVSCHLRTGTLGIDEISPRHAYGRFSGTGSCLTSSGEHLEDIAILGGTFRVPLR